ncbi:MAG: response regulator [Gammaproteobacteria bacterium]|jgi:PleD family two-component response regulator|nr:response regulator [Gammaproteobacteria bacterium]
MDKHRDPTQLPRPRLLFVDSSRLMRKAADRILGEEFRVFLAGDTEQAWVTLLDDPLIQVVFFDQESDGGGNGPGLLERIRTSESRRVRETPIVILTENADSEERRTALLHRGATDFIDKPFRPSELVARARAHASITEAVQRLRQLQKRHNKCTETGLGNRRYFFERLAQSLSFARRHHQPLSLVHIHMDGLTRSLERLDALKRKRQMAGLGRVLLRAVRHEDTVYRTGPETFSFILPGTNEAGAEAVRCRLIPELDGMGLLNGRKPLEVQSRFIVQSPDFGEEESLIECLRRIREGMGTLLVTHPPDRSPSSRTADDDLEALLDMARHGDTEHLREHLPELLARLKPLLELANQLERSSPPGAADQTPPNSR